MLRSKLWVAPNPATEISGKQKYVKQKTERKLAEYSLKGLKVILFFSPSKSYVLDHSESIDMHIEEKKT